VKSKERKNLSRASLLYPQSRTSRFGHSKVDAAGKKARKRYYYEISKIRSTIYCGQNSSSIYVKNSAPER
jgi:hypothetical protein